MQRNHQVAMKSAPEQMPHQPFVPQQSEALPPSALETRRLGLIVGTILLNLVSVTLLTAVPTSNWRTGLALNLFDNFLFAGFLWWYQDRVLGRLMAYGLIVGLVELVADAWLVDITRTLDYSIGGGPMLWRSPIWMPLAWQVVTVQFAVVGLRLLRWRRGLGLLLTGLLGAINIPYYEEMARLIHWWQYTNCRMISGTPYYIVLGEFGIAMALAWCAQAVPTGKPSAIIRAGSLAGLGILVSYVGAYEIAEYRW